MLALDLDGTILLPDGTPSARVVGAVARAAGAGYRICVATGRNYTECKWIIEQLGLRDECVFVGGAVVIDTATGRALHRTAMHPEVAAEVSAVFEEMGHAALALQDTCATGVDYVVTSELPLRPASSKWMEMVRMNIQYAPRLARFEHRHTLRVGICCEEAEAEGMLEVLQKRFGNRTMMHRLHVPGANCEVVEVFDPAVSKWEGIQFVARRHGIEPHEIIAVGDDMNDLQMVRHSGLGVAMGNARGMLKPAADLVIGTNVEDGLAVFIEELLEGGGEDTGTRGR